MVILFLCWFWRALLSCHTYLSVFLSSKIELIWNWLCITRSISPFYLHSGSRNAIKALSEVRFLENHWICMIFVERNPCTSQFSFKINLNIYLHNIMFICFVSLPNNMFIVYPINICEWLIILVVNSRNAVWFEHHTKLWMYICRLRYYVWLYIYPPVYCMENDYILWVCVQDIIGVQIRQMWFYLNKTWRKVPQISHLT